MTHITDADGAPDSTDTLQDQAIRLLKDQLGIGAEVRVLQELSDGYTDAVVAKCDVSDAAESTLDGQYIVKAAPVTGRRQSAAHQHFYTSLPPDFADEHIAGLALTADSPTISVDVYEIAGGSLRGVHAVERANSQRFLNACSVVSGELIEAQLATVTGKIDMSTTEIIESWLGRGFLTGRRGQALQEVRALAGVTQAVFPLSGEMLPDPLTVLGRSSAFTEHRELVLQGACHGDLHLRNILLDATRSFRTAYWLIDVGWDEPAPLLYDQAYLETAALLGLQARSGRAISLSVLGECDDVTVHGEQLDILDQSFVDVVNAIRRPTLQALDRRQPRRKDSLDYQYVLARLTAALNYAAKRGMRAEERVTAFHTAAWVTREILKKYHVDEWHDLLKQASIPGAQRSTAVTATPSSPRPTTRTDNELSALVKNFQGGPHTGYDLFLLVEDGISVPAMAGLIAHRWAAILDFDPQSDSTGLASIPRPPAATHHQILQFGLNDGALSSSRGVIPWAMADGWQSHGELQQPTFANWRKHNRPVLLRLLERISRQTTNRAAAVLCLTLGDDPHERVSRVLEDIEDLYELVEVHQVSAATQDMAVLLEKFNESQIAPRSGRPATMPGKNGPVVFERDQLTRLAVDLDVLHSACLTDQLQDQPTDEFWRGRPATWMDLDAGLDVPRDAQQALEQDLRKVLGSRAAETLELFHTPGAGGTTLARRIAWDLHRQYPVVLLRNYSQDTVERVDEIYRRTSQPVLVVAESADVSQAERDNLYQRLRQWNTPAVLLWVTRTNKPGRGSVYRLTDPMSPGELSEFSKNYSLRAGNERAKAAVESLRRGQAPPQQLSPFFFGLAAFEENFIGTQGYVESHLANLDEKRRRAVKYLALVTRFAQNGLPYPLVRRWLTGKWGDMSASERDYQADLLQVLGEDLRHLVVDDGGELRLLHPFVAEHVLVALLESEDGRSWEDRLADTAVEFITQVCIHQGSENAQTRKILQDLFIRRDKWSTDQPAGVRFAELITRIPVRDAAYRVFLELTRKCPSEPHFWNHLGRYHIHEMKLDFEKAEGYLEKAIKLSLEKDSIHFHTLGMVRRVWVRDLLQEMRPGAISVEEALAQVLPIYDAALEAFTRGRTLNLEDEHGYVTPVQMIAQVLNQLVKISQRENFLGLVRDGGDVGRWADEQLHLAESLLDQLDMARPGHRKSTYYNKCEGDLGALYGSVRTLVREWRSLIAESESHSGIALVLARAFFKEEQREGDGSSHESLRAIVELYDNVFHVDGRLNDSDVRTWFRCYRQLDEYEELRALERFAILNHEKQSLECNYYLYVLRFLRWFRGDEQSQLEAQRYLEESKRLARDSRRQYSYEWMAVAADGGASAIPELVHFTELGERRDEPVLWERPERLLKVSGVIQEIEGPQLGWISVAHGHMRAFFAPKDKFLRSRDINAPVEFYLGFSYEGLRAWSVEFVTSSSAASPTARFLNGLEQRRNSSPIEASADIGRHAPPSRYPDPPQAPAPRAGQATPQPIVSSAMRLAATRKAEVDVEEAYRILIRQLLAARSPEQAGISGLEVGKALQDTFGPLSYTRVLGQGKLRACVERLGFRTQASPRGGFEVLDPSSQPE
ncbi:hypothetical protein PV341_27695 [Streptomyces sp. PA03-1a]|nr:hypothetical protein [Streptomyces sp. PA03-1a]MDX2812007.1 hypothetical protein [Streptomyces sp. PA03-5A]